MKRFVTSLIPSLLIVSALHAEGKVVTTRKKLKLAPEYTQRAAVAIDDTLRDATCQLLRLSGFDKPLRSGKETLFITNNSPHHLTGVILLCRYFDSKGRQLHQRTVTARCDIPAGATCQVSFKSWDVQQAFYYKLSPKPRKASGSPFDAKVSVTAIITEHCENGASTTE